MSRIPRQLSLAWMRRHKPEATAGAAVALGVALVLAGLVVRATDGDDVPPSAASGSSTGPVQKQQVDDYVPPKDQKGLKKAAGAGLGLGKPTGFGALSSFDLNGLSGTGGVKNLPKHSLVMTMTSRDPIGTIGYVIPTSTEKSSGVVKDAGTSWTLSTTVYGNPDYAQMFAQAGARGFPVTCTITVDGKVTERRSTEGPYGQLFCQG